MAERVDKGTWVEIRNEALSVGEGAPQLPEDTRQVPLEMRVRGFLAAAAVMGEQAEILTSAGRRLRGTLSEVNPAYSHGFGAPVTELWAIGSEVRALLRERRRRS